MFNLWQVVSFSGSSFCSLGTRRQKTDQRSQRSLLQWQSKGVMVVGPITIQHLFHLHHYYFFFVSTLKTIQQWGVTSSKATSFILPVKTSCPALNGPVFGLSLQSATVLKNKQRLAWLTGPNFVEENLSSIRKPNLC